MKILKILENLVSEKVDEEAGKWPHGVLQVCCSLLLMQHLEGTAHGS